MNSLLKNHTWDLVPRPKNRQIVTNKIILKHKKNEMGQITRLKARLVARRFSQIYGVDYLDTYAPVVKLASIRILHAIAAINSSDGRGDGVLGRRSGRRDIYGATGRI